MAAATKTPQHSHFLDEGFALAEHEVVVDVGDILIQSLLTA
jgi:hypothetical protein